jgi:hypothetical protein
MEDSYVEAHKYIMHNFELSIATNKSVTFDSLTVTEGRDKRYSF